MSKIKVLAFAGSAREASFNKKLIRVAAKAAESAGAEVTLVDLRDFPMPIYDGDLEEQEGAPEHAHRLKQIMIEHDALLIASPEYNSALSPLLKNTIDWVSRKTGDEPSLAAFRGKTAAIMSASPGGLGGLRGLNSLRSILDSINVLVIPEQTAVQSAHEAFAQDGTLAEAKQAQVEAITARLVAVTSALKS